MISNESKLQSLSAKEQFLNTIEKDIENGLVDLKFYRNSNGADSSENVYAEINEMWANGKPKSSDSPKL